MQLRSRHFSALVERVSGPVCQLHGNAAEKNMHVALGSAISSRTAPFNFVC